MSKRKYHFEGKRINNFTVQSLIKGKFVCVCDCGNIRHLTGYALNKGMFKSCGCLIDFEKKEYEVFFWNKFWSQVIDSASGCKNWQGVKRGGYGRINYKGKTNGCTRLVWEKVNGKIPESYLICHRCDNPSCVNIAHLFLGTKLENMIDCVKKGRKNGIKGEKNGQSKLKDFQVVEIKKLLNMKISCPKIAKKFSVGASTIKRIKHGLTWKHIQ